MTRQVIGIEPDANRGRVGHVSPFARVNGKKRAPHGVQHNADVCIALVGGVERTVGRQLVDPLLRPLGGLLEQLTLVCDMGGILWSAPGVGGRRPLEAQGQSQVRVVERILR